MIACLILAVRHVLVGLLVAGWPPVVDSPAKLLPEFISHKQSIFSIAFSPDGNLLAVAGGQFVDRFSKQLAAAELIVWDLKTRTKSMTIVGHKACINSVVFSPDGKVIASCSHDKTVRLWDVATGKELAVLHESDMIMALAFSPDGKTLAGSIWSLDENSDPPPGTVLLWDVKERKLRAKLEGHVTQVPQIAFSPDGTTLAAASSAWDKKARESRGQFQYAEIKLWDPATGKLKMTFTGHKGGRVNTVAFSPDGKSLATGCVVRTGEDTVTRRGEVTVWDVATGRARVTGDVNKAGVDVVAFSHDGKLLAAASEMQVKSLDDYTSEVAILDPQSLKRLATLPDLDDPGTLAFSPVRPILAIPLGKKVKMWDLSKVR